MQFTPALGDGRVSSSIMSNPIEAARARSELAGPPKTSLTAPAQRITTPSELPTCSHCGQPISGRGVNGLTVDAFRGQALVERVQILTLHERCALADLRVAVSILRQKFRARKDIAVKAFVSFNRFM
jgi:hypothetical protein